ncbi:class II fructose-bisphosphate aldolase [Gammaproteobacteria bacterium]|nr:class II fructose-bisphosphate aldolase [Gammaproteobacteria bacterium]
MPVVSTNEILQDAFSRRYGVAAFNIINALSIEAMIQAATELQSPLLIQTSVKTVKAIGLAPLYAMFRAYADPAPIPVALHLDHCPDREVITGCLKTGWNSVLFDGSHLPSVEENKRQCIEVVAEAKQYGAHVEGEIEGIQGVEDGIGSDEASDIYSLETAVDFVKSTGIDIFAPAIGNAHGVYKAEPNLDTQRVSDIVAQAPIPICLHGGTGLTAEQFDDLIARGCAKVNISTALKVSFMNANREFLDANPDCYDPPKLLSHVKQRLIEMAKEHILMFHSEGKAA